MSKIRFGTDGWRAIIADEFTTANVARLAEASALWVKNQGGRSVVLGHDCRFGGELFVETAARVFCHQGVRVHLATTFVTAPMVSMGTLQTGSTLGVFITASHNPPLYNGYKLKGSYGGPLLEEQVLEVEALIPDTDPPLGHKQSVEEMEQDGLLEHIDLEEMYCQHLSDTFDLEAMLKPGGMRFAFDAMYGSGQNVMRRLFPGILLMHCTRQPLFDGIPPEPLAKNLEAFSKAIRKDGNIHCGLAVDGDADRTALMDQQGNYIDSHHVILLLIHYLHHYKQVKGKVATGFSSSVKIHQLCQHYGIPIEVVKIGFKHICGIMLREEVLVGGEESGGIAVAGHIPERDGIYNGLLIWEAMVRTGKTLTELIREVYDITGPFAFERSDLTLPSGEKERIVENCQKGVYDSFGHYKVQRTEDLDGFKYYFSDSQWLMIRPSGTEPVLRTYAEGADRREALDILKAAYDTIIKQ